MTLLNFRLTCSNSPSAVGQLVGSWHTHMGVLVSSSSHTFPFLQWCFMQGSVKNRPFRNERIHAQNSWIKDGYVCPRLQLLFGQKENDCPQMLRHEKVQTEWKSVINTEHTNQTVGHFGRSEGRCSRLSFLKRTRSGFILYSDVHIHSWLQNANW